MDVECHWDTSNGDEQRRTRSDATPADALFPIYTSAVSCSRTDPGAADFTNVNTDVLYNESTSTTAGTAVSAIISFYLDHPSKKTWTGVQAKFAHTSTSRRTRRLDGQWATADVPAHVASSAVLGATGSVSHKNYTIWYEQCQSEPNPRKLLWEPNAIPTRIWIATDVLVSEPIFSLRPNESTLWILWYESALAIVTCRGTANVRYQRF